MLFGRRAQALFLAFFLLFTSFAVTRPIRTVSAYAPEDSPAVIIDAGHGGTDAGAIGVKGTLEKDLNLVIAEALAARFRDAGIPVLMTRTEDALVLYEGEDIKGQRKSRDLYNRAAFAEKYPNATFISIHMNAFPVEKYRGLQVYYNKNSAESARLAQSITAKVKAELDPVYTRVPNFRGEELYLLSHITGRAVLIECGFLSNAEEEAKLLEKDYQNKLSFCIFCAIMEK